ncbi:MAG TPA: hypothetical protein PL155_06590 [Candidatus Omnitrophota bacterium]|nr:hypothetical protein [Candidatus Omnitrophota bacterium]HPD83853.1 hypothetical protein [Candidatus Omnitrophota bacterium]HRZ02710.1 hypothetical protein [Candidatus Omnitrophota bacterium]
MEGNKTKWYFRKEFIVIGFLIVGPLILPLLWANPGISRIAKWVWSVIFILGTVALFALAPILTNKLISMLGEGSF